MVPPKGQMVQQWLLWPLMMDRMHHQHVFLFYGSIIDDSHHEAHTPYLLQCLALDVKLSNQDLSIHFLVSLCSSSGADSIHEEYSGSNVEYSEAARAMCLNMTG